MCRPSVSIILQPQRINHAGLPSKLRNMATVQTMLCVCVCVQMNKTNMFEILMSFKLLKMLGKIWSIHNSKHTFAQQCIRVSVTWRTIGTTWRTDFCNVKDNSLIFTNLCMFVKMCLISSNDFRYDQCNLGYSWILG